MGPVKTRTRTGCRECRLSRVRCDEIKPSCTRCREKGLVCSSPLILKWESEFVSRGQAFGRAGVWSKFRSAGAVDETAPQNRRQSLVPSSPSFPPAFQEWCLVPTIHSWVFVNSSVSTFEDPHQVSVGPDDPNTLVVRRDAVSDQNMQLLFAGSTAGHENDILIFQPLPPALPGPGKSLSLFPHLSKSPSEILLFDYYLQQVYPRTTASSRSTSPFAAVILPFCLTASPTLFSAIQALGACHWSRFDSTYHAVSLRLKSAALRDLHRRISTRGFLSCSADPEVLVVMMMLCLCEIVDNCDQHWTVHLKGAKELIRLRRQHNATLPLPPPPITQEQDPASAFAESFFAFQDVMGRTACGEEVIFGSDYWQEKERTINPWMGCSPELASILSSITELSRTRRQVVAEAAKLTLVQRAASLACQLENLVQQTDDGEDGTLRTAAELKRLAALLYLHCALYGGSPATPLVSEYVHMILLCVSGLLDRGSVVGITWPLFVAAVELDPANDEVWSEGEAVIHGRPLVLRALAAMAESTVSNVARTRAVIAKVWQARDLDMLQGSSAGSPRDSASCNDWEWYVAPISTAMSLA